jgi:hypothetical protein
MSFRKTTFRVRLILLRGVLRRLLLTLFRPGYVRAQRARRRGECVRCGACCQLAWKCPRYHDPDGLPSCLFYGRCRPPNCGNFPIDQRDIADRNRICPDQPCGYSWPEDEKKGPGKTPG